MYIRGMQGIQNEGRQPPAVIVEIRFTPEGWSGVCHTFGTLACASRNRVLACVVSDIARCIALAEAGLVGRPSPSVRDRNRSGILDEWATYLIGVALNLQSISLRPDVERVELPRGED